MEGKKEMDAVALLKADHRKVEELFEKFEAARGTKQKIAEQICMELIIHSTIEDEHDSAKVLIAEILAGGPDDAFYDAKVKVLSEQIKHHVKEEEKRSEGLFAEAKEAGLDMDALGERMSARKEELKQEYASGLPTPQTRSFKGIELEHGEPVEQAA